VTYEAREAMGCSIALPRNDVIVGALQWPVCNGRPSLFLNLRQCRALVCAILPFGLVL
jgi:hypothetical protein